MTVQVSVPVSAPQLYSHGAGDFRPYAPAGGGGGGFFPFAMPTSPVTIPSRWYFYGDSQTSGRANSYPSAVSHHVAFTNIWTASGFTAPTYNSGSNYGGSGQTLTNKRASFASTTIAGVPWVHVQDSGQQSTGTATPEEFGDTFEGFMRDINTRFPTAVITYESAYSFGPARAAETGRDWEGTQHWASWGYPNEGAAISYNESLYNRIQVLRDDGIVVYPIYTCEYVNEFVNRVSYAALEEDANPYHYDGVGNLLIALAMYKGLGYNINTLNLSTITVSPDSTTNNSLKNTCIDIINTLGA